MCSASSAWCPAWWGQSQQQQGEEEEDGEESLPWEEDNPAYIHHAGPQWEADESALRAGWEPDEWEAAEVQPETIDTIYEKLEGGGFSVTTRN